MRTAAGSLGFWACWFWSDKRFKEVVMENLKPLFMRWTRRRAVLQASSRPQCARPSHVKPASSTAFLRLQWTPSNISRNGSFRLIHLHENIKSVYISLRSITMKCFTCWGLAMMTCWKQIPQISIKNQATSFRFQLVYDGNWNLMKHTNIISRDRSKGSILYLEMIGSTEREPKT